MDKNAIKNYAIFARRKLLQATKDKCATFGIYPNGKTDEPVLKGTGYEIYKSSTGAEVTLRGKDIDARRTLVNRIKADGFDATVEEVAYTWFNRLIAIRFMEVNNYLPTRVRVLSSDTLGRVESDLMNAPFDADLNYTDKERELIANYKSANNTDELFKVLFLRQCRDLSDILPGLFENLENYKELLFNIRFNDKDDVVYKLVYEIPESNFDVSMEGQIEIIGWLYQYYNTEPKDKVFANLKKNIKISKENIPAATQLFTPDWIVRYMVENSLGRLWVEGHPNDELKSNWNYYLEEAEQEADVQKQLAAIRKEYAELTPEDIKCIDPCMGSGHILVYMFDVLMQIYESYGYTQRDAARLIVEKNLYGLDIDKRAYQLSYFAVMMKARQYNRRILNGELTPNVFAIQDSSALTQELIDFIANGDNTLRSSLQSIKADLKDASEYGSILDVSSVNFERIFARMEEIESCFYDDIIGQLNQRICREAIIPLIVQAQIMSNKYFIVCTNPPYMGASGMSSRLVNYVKVNCPDSKGDLSTVFMEKTLSMCSLRGFMAMINIPVWMFLTSYEKLRCKLLSAYTITNMVHPGRGIFGSDFGSTAFVIRKDRVPAYKSSYRRLFDEQGEVKSIDAREQAFLAKKGQFVAQQDKFSQIPGTPIAYWISKNVYEDFSKYKKLGEIAETKTGMTTGDNERFLKLWFEIESLKIGGDFQFYSKGSDFRRWYCSVSNVIFWKNDGADVKAFKGSTIRNEDSYFKKCIVWNLITSGAFSARAIFNHQCVMGDASPAAHTKEYDYLFILAALNTKPMQLFLNIINPTINCSSGVLSVVPIGECDDDRKKSINIMSQNCIDNSVADWDSFETSWDFEEHPLLKNKVDTIKKAYTLWDSECNDRFNTLKHNEEELNRIFIDIYGLNDELTPEVEDKDVTVRKADLTRDIKSLISYAVGCMFGRYSLDTKGLAYAGGEWDSSKYSTFVPDTDNIIPIRDEEFFEDDDIVSRFVEFIRVAYGDSTLEENLTFIADALSNSGNSAREVIRNYFVNDFYKDHCQTYQVTGSGKRPIYWLFNSGKQNGFKALIYMHRYDADTVGRVRTDYLHKIQGIYEARINADNYTIDTSSVKSDVAKARKHKEKVEKQLAETRLYDQALAHIANKRISIDLDDGVKVNYAKFQEVEVINDVGKTVKVDLLEKIK